MFEISWLQAIVSILVGIFGIIYSLSTYRGSDRRVTLDSKSMNPGTKKLKTALTGPFSLEEVAKHNKSDDCWIIVDGYVYDVTTYVEEHPGGDSILNNAGGDCTEGVHGPQHPVSMFDVLALYKIGELSK
jgi:cytochrome b involved in lipid metabolism